MDGFSPRKLRNYYLLNPEEEGERRFNLHLKTRANKLAGLALDVWAAPKLAADVWATDKPAPTLSASGYTISDDPHLCTGALKEVFEAFRKGALELDPCVTEEFLKLDVA